MKRIDNLTKDDIKKGKFKGIGVCINILNNEGKKRYKKIKNSALGEYKKIENSAFWDIAIQRKYRNRSWK